MTADSGCTHRGAQLRAQADAEDMTRLSPTTYEEECHGDRSDHRG